MSFLKSSRTPNNKVSSNNELIGFDILFQLSYMSATAASGIARSQIFEHASRLPLASSPYFVKVLHLCKKMGYDYPVACRLVGESAKNEKVKSLLLRLAASLSSGEPEAEFLAREAQVQADSFGNEYERSLETLKKWTDAYVALIVSASIVVVVAMVSMLIYPVGTGFIMGLLGVMVAVSILGAWIIYRIVPKEIKPLSRPETSRGQRLALTLFKIVTPAALLVSAALAVMGVKAGLVMIAAGAMLLPVGLVSVIDDKKLDKKDGEISTFIRSLGSVATAIGTTVAVALDRIDIRSMGSLAPEIKKLAARLMARIRPDICWREFVSETGSEMVNRSVTMFRDAIDLGGEAEEIGQRSSMLAMKISFLRAKRQLISSTFGWLALAMHGITVAILVFVIEIVGAFGNTVMTTMEEMSLGSAGGLSASSMGIFSFNPETMQLLRLLVVPLILLLSGVNAFAPKAADGGHNCKLLYFLGVTLITSGGILLLGPVVASLIFTSGA